MLPILRRLLQARYAPYLILTCLAYIFLGTLAFIWQQQKIQSARVSIGGAQLSISNVSPDVMFVASVAGILFVIGAFLFLYLRSPGITPGTRLSRPPSIERDNELGVILLRLQELRRSAASIEEISARLDRLDAKITEKVASRGSELSVLDRREIVEAVVSDINSTVSEEFVRAIEAKFASAIIRSQEAGGLLAHFDELKSRLLRAIAYLERRGNLNLIIGIITTLGAVAGLFYVVFQSHEFQNTWDVLTHYIPRISFVIFVEVFAYFFLRLYKSNVEDVKYYHNELTNVDARLIALRAALLTGDDASVKAIATTLSKTERNYVLKRGETTAELEKAKIEKKDVSDSLRQVFGLFKLITKQEK